ncbi:hypothetical protein QAD02_014156 [Eretmocerus hayati]|uniref:Uncharacterized protein n=1 Tax=Eretmocerus hayati TaxID=131215 RepID=A0ACC2P447_9HYME|nr:hypothetical protein QAD02_014156 [Eretmocerus hayati]
MDNVEIVKFLLSLYSNPRIPRNVVQILVDNITHYSQKIQIPNIKKEISDILQGKCSTEDLRSIEKILIRHSNPFENLETEHKRFKYFEERGFYIPPQTKNISVTTREKKKGNKIARVEQYVTIEYIPLKTSFKLFLEKKRRFFRSS